MSLYQPLFRALNESGARYVVVGGVATVLHGYARLTADIDLIIDLERDALLSGLDALTSLGLVPRLPVQTRAFADPQTREAWRREKGMQVFSLHDPANPLLSVDLFVDHPIEFEELWARSEICDLGLLSVRIASIADLIRLKQIANRPRDREDIAKLEEIQRLRPNREPTENQEP